MAIADSAARPRTVTELIDAAFSLARLDFGLLLMIAGLALVTSFPLQIAYLRLLEGQHWAIGLLVLLARTALLGVFSGAGVVAASEAYFGRAMNPLGSVRAAFRRARALVHVALVTQIATVLGFVALIIPGFIAIAYFFAAVPAVVIEGRGREYAVKRSHELSRGNERRIIATLVATGILFLALQASADTMADWMHASPLMTVVLTDVVNVVFWPFYYTLTVALYYDARIRNEAFDLTLMLEEAPAPID